MASLMLAVANTDYFSLVRVVDPDQWPNMPEDLIPLYLGTQFGIFPHDPLEKAWQASGARHAIFGKSALSGREAGLRIHLEDGQVLGPYWTIPVNEKAARERHREPFPLLLPPIQWVDREVVSISFWTLIIRYDRLNALAGQHPDLAARIRQWGATNGRLWWAIEMNSPPWSLLELIEEELQPSGLTRGTDYVLLDEQCPNLQLSEQAGQTLPALQDVPWLDSRILPDGTQQVQFRPHEVKPGQ